VQLPKIYKFQHFIGGTFVHDSKFYFNLLLEVLRQNFDDFNIRAYRHTGT